MFFAAYVGPSMNPTLREPAMMEIVPYDNTPVRVGDVVLFSPPRSNRPVVHRIARVTPAGLSTLGDNNTREDPCLLQPTDIQGRVVAVWRGQKRRIVAGGLRGRLAVRRLRWLRPPGRGVSRVLHPLYHALSHRGRIARLLPAPARPRVVVFHGEDQDQVRVVWGQLVIGRYDTQNHRWQIRRPFRVFVDERALPQPSE
jgi:signal peptidase